MATLRIKIPVKNIIVIVCSPSPRLVAPPPTPVHIIDLISPKLLTIPLKITHFCEKINTSARLMVENSGTY
jgi:hypothetical protein